MDRFIDGLVPSEFELGKNIRKTLITLFIGWLFVKLVTKKKEVSEVLQAL
jgi:hypothetical protein